MSHFACSEFPIFANISSEMKKILLFIVTVLIGFTNGDAAVRDGNNGTRGGGAVSVGTQKRVSTTPRVERTTLSRTTVLNKSTNNASRGTNDSAQATRQSPATGKNVTARATVSTSETRTGEQYETCKNAYFTCMDQFCSLKNDEYRRC